MDTVIEHIEKNAGLLRNEAAECERLGKLSDNTVAAMRESCVVKMLQPKAFGGSESHPADFLKAVHTLASHNSSAGWVSGVVGLHPWEVAQMPTEVQSQVWSADSDVWVASPYAPIGKAEPVEGGYIFTGRWPFSSGTDHCNWALLGGMASTDLNDPLHFLIPRSDYEIVEDSWNVAGLAGTGSKDVVIKGAFVPSERVIPFREVSHGNANSQWESTSPLYRMPYVVLFPGAITAASLGICQGALNTYTGIAMQKGVKQQTESKLIVLAEAAADIEASTRIMLDDVSQVFDLVSAGKSISIEERIRVRRNQVRGVRRSLEAVNALHRMAGSAGLRNDQAFSRIWRDANVAGNHATNTPEPILRGYGLSKFGEEVPEVLRMGPAPIHSTIPVLQ